MSTLDGFGVEVENAGFGRGPDRSVLRICKWAGVAIAETSNVVFIPAESLFLRGPGICQCEN